MAEIELEASIKASSKTEGVAGRHINVSAGIFVPFAEGFGRAQPKNTLKITSVEVKKR